MRLIQHLAQQIHEMPVLIIGTYRNVALNLSFGHAGLLRTPLVAVVMTLALRSRCLGEALPMTLWMS